MTLTEKSFVATMKVKYPVSIFYFMLEGSMSIYFELKEGRR